MMMEILTNGEMIPVLVAAYALASEVIGMNPKWKSNSVVQMTMNVLKRMIGIK